MNLSPGSLISYVLVTKVVVYNIYLELRSHLSIYVYDM